MGPPPPPQGGLATAPAREALALHMLEQLPLLCKEDTGFMQRLARARFLPTQAGGLARPSDLWDPSVAQLRELLQGGQLYPRFLVETLFSAVCPLCGPPLAPLALRLAPLVPAPRSCPSRSCSSPTASCPSRTSASLVPTFLFDQLPGAPNEPLLAPP